MLTWPQADGDFREHFPKVEQTFLRIAAAISQFEPVQINYRHDHVSLLLRIAAVGGIAERVSVHTVESDDVWARDHGPITIVRDGQLVHLDFTFNGWGGKFAADNDDLITRRLADMSVWKAPVETHEFVLEGGGIEVDGEGTLLTTERCLLAPTRNPNFTQAGIENYLNPLFGTQRVLWLKHGDLLGDDTDGHIDTLARFCSPGLIAYQGCNDPEDPHFEELSFMEAELKSFRRANGEPYQLVPLPLPDPIYDDDGERLPAGYANFLIVNGGVLVPVYGVPQDLEALRQLRPCFPDRKVVPVDCRWLIRQYGSLHCVTMQIPALPG
jgi:agmatine/peptidylarginine deiminase